VIDYLALSGALLAGLGIGAFYFAGLWLTVRQLVQVPNPAPLFLLSFMGRTAASIAAFYFVMDGDWTRAAAAMVGFLAMRVLTTRTWGPQWN
jgi:F1F0 ATPase subunit 2